jgi:RNA polymerase sigma-70 factor (ECF subfamily)
LKYQDAADALGIPVGTVKSRLHAALTKLTEEWGRESQDEVSDPHDPGPRNRVAATRKGAGEL